MKQGRGAERSGKAGSAEIRNDTKPPKIACRHAINVRINERSLPQTAEAVAAGYKALVRTDYGPRSCYGSLALASSAMT